MSDDEHDCEALVYNVGDGYDEERSELMDVLMDVADRLAELGTARLFCAMHEGTPMTDAEGGDYEAGLDRCLMAVRLMDPDATESYAEPEPEVVVPEATALNVIEMPVWSSMN